MASRELSALASSVHVLRAAGQCDVVASFEESPEADPFSNCSRMRFALVCNNGACVILHPLYLAHKTVSRIRRQLAQERHLLKHLFQSLLLRA